MKTLEKQQKCTTINNSTQCCHPELDSGSILNKRGLWIKPAMTNRFGFTLVELVITIAIVIILSVISVPIYRGYVNKANDSEGYALLGTIFSAEKAYFSEHGHFYKDRVCAWTEFQPLLGIDARGNKYFSLFRIDQNGNYGPSSMFGAFITRPAELGGHSQIRLFYNITTGSTIFECDISL